MRPPDFQIATGRQLTREENHHRILLNRQLTRLNAQHDALVFVLGSYRSHRKPRLRNVREKIETSLSGDIAARFMTDFLDETDEQLSGHLKFRIIARHADALIGVVEDDRGGFTYEQGVIGENPNLFMKTFVLKKAYAKLIEHQKYSWMQATTTFDELENINRIYEWHGYGDGFANSRDELLDDLAQFLR